jgi:VanZ family protein
MSEGAGRLFASAVVWASRFLLSVFATWLCVATLTPQGGGLGLTGWDKADHVIAFYLLAVLASLSVPRLKLLLVFAGLFGASALAEAFQGYIDREPDILDLAANALGAAAALGPMALSRLRRTASEPLRRRPVERWRELW